jgi:hypothetical protein
MGLTYPAQLLGSDQQDQEGVGIYRAAVTVCLATEPNTKAAWICEASGNNASR